ncbi:STAS/SEC14 domain-containing protein [Ilumatobacter sp.]|uniref:STAS/SEC14 domain-containing protein n=1 Tax=Ilumatobacter sp. TaxID=1967498 RepID=UPI003C3299B2
MLEPIDDLPAGCFGLHAVGTFTVDDFTTYIEPEVDAVVERHEKLRLVLHLGDRFEGFGDGAWGDLTDGLRHIHFHRGAVVTDDGHLSAGINVLKWTLHGHVRTFHDRELDTAIHWVST